MTKLIQLSQSNCTFKLVRFVIFFVIFGLFLSCKSFAISSEGLSDYLGSVDQNSGFATNYNDEVQKILLEANYDKIYLKMDPKDFAFLVSNQDRNKEKTIKIHGMVVKKREKRSGLFGKIMSLSLPSTEFRDAEMTLRGALSLYCGKPSFKIKNKQEDIDYRLKGFCGAHYGVEEKLFGQVSSDISSALVNDYHIYNYDSNYTVLFVNGRIYGLYLAVPDLDKGFFAQNGVIEVSKSQNCIFKVPAFVGKNSNPYDVTSRMEIISPNARVSNLVGVYNLEYGNKESCLPKLESLVTKANQTFDYTGLSKIVNIDSVLLRGMINVYTNNEVSLTHNHLLVRNDGKFNMGFRDTEDFHGCQNVDLLTYKPNDKYYNILFTKILEYYQKNNPDKIRRFTQLIQANICDSSVYNNFKNAHLKYIFADRFLRNMGNVRQIDVGEDVSANQKMLLGNLQKIYDKQIDFNIFYKKQYNFFDEYFGIE